MKLQALCLLFGLGLLAAPPARAASKEPVALAPRAAVAKALQCNLGLRYAKLAPALSTAPERAARSFTDTILYADLTLKGVGDRFAVGGTPAYSTSLEAALGVKKRFFTGTALDVKVAGDVGLSGGDPETGLGADGGGSASLTVSHPLLRGGSADVNRSAVTRARLDRQAAQATLERKAEVLAATVLKAYWDLHAAQAQVRIQTVALQTARKTLSETLDLIRLGRIPAADADSARLLVQTRERALSVARQDVANAQDKLARLTGLVGPRSLETPLLRAGAPDGLAAPADLRALQRTALARRGDHRALRLQLRNAGVSVEAARDALRPKLDLVGNVSVGASHSAVPGSDRSTHGRATFTVGLSFELPVGRRDAQAAVEIAVLKRRQARLAIQQSEQSITETLKIKWRAVHAAQRRVALSRQSVRVAETKLQNEQARFRAGKTTAQLLALVHADVTREALALETAEAEHRKALVDLWAASGALLSELQLAAK